jgi:hypothetical protein
MSPGTRVILSARYGYLRRGVAGVAMLEITNGASGVVVGSSPGAATVVVAFDDIGSDVGVSVPTHWLTILPG